MQKYDGHPPAMHTMDVALGWLMIRIPETKQVLWVLVAHCPKLFERDLVLLTNVPLRTAHDVTMVYTEWRYRPKIEHTSLSEKRNRRISMRRCKRHRDAACTVFRIGSPIASTRKMA